jgi:ribosomal protein L14E/L6E/L27E
MKKYLFAMAIVREIEIGLILIQVNGVNRGKLNVVSEHEDSFRFCVGCYELLP